MAAVVAEVALFTAFLSFLFVWFLVLIIIFARNMRENLGTAVAKDESNVHNIVQCTKYGYSADVGPTKQAIEKEKN